MTAILLAAGAVLTAMFGYLEWRERRRTQTLVAMGEKQEQVLAKLATNHGKEPWQYLEMVEDVRRNQEMLLGLFVEHTAQDAREFEDLRHRIAS